MLQNSYFEKLLRVKNVMESFFKIKTFKSLKEVMDAFFGIENFKSCKKVVESFFSIYNFKREKVMETFFSGHALLSFHMMYKFPGTIFFLSVPAEIP